MALTDLKKPNYGLPSATDINYWTQDDREFSSYGMTMVDYKCPKCKHPQTMDEVLSRRAVDCCPKCNTEFIIN